MRRFRHIVCFTNCTSLAAPTHKPYYHALMRALLFVNWRISTKYLTVPLNWHTYFVLPIDAIITPSNRSLTKSFGIIFCWKSVIGIPSCNYIYWPGLFIHALFLWYSSVTILISGEYWDVTAIRLHCQRQSFTYLRNKAPYTAMDTKDICLLFTSIYKQKYPTIRIFINIVKFLWINESWQLQVG